MIGFDRPLRPEWIYEILKTMKVGDNPSNYNQPFELIAKELVGKEGKRKARTVIYRSFIYSFQKSRSKIENNIFFDLVKSCSLDEMKPLFLAKIIMDYEILKTIVSKIRISFDSNNMISTKIITKKVVDVYGDKEIVKRSVRAFLKTLCNFGILEQVVLQKFQHISQLKLTQEQTKNFLILYSLTYVKTNFVNIDDIDENIVYFFQNPPFIDTARKFNGIYWEYIRERKKNAVLIYNPIYK